MVKMTYLYTFEDGHQETHIYDSTNESSCESMHRNFESRKMVDSLVRNQKKDNIVQSEIVSKEEY